MITEISPIFGLSLLELVEILDIIAAFSAGIVAGAILFVHRRQHNLQIKANSADLVTRIREDWSMSRNPDFAEFLKKLGNKSVEDGDQMIPRFVRVLEKVAIFADEGTITENHVREFFGGNLRHVTGNKPVHEYLKNEWEKPCPHFTKLQKLLEKSQRWD